MILNENEIKKLFELHELYGQAEEAMKHFELLNNVLCVPATNQLRYVGFHLLKGLVNKNLNSDERLKEIDLAIGHAKRALFDVYESCAIFTLERIKKFNDDYSDIPISPVISNIAALKSRIKLIISELSQFRNTKENRYVYFDNCKKHHIELEEIAELFDNSRDELNKSITSGNKQKILNIIIVIIGVATLFFTIFPLKTIISFFIRCWTPSLTM